MKKAAVLVIHGIGTDTADYDLAFQRALFARLRALDKDPDELAYQKVFWADYLNNRQKEYYDCCVRNPAQKIGWRRLRREVLERLGDASAYEWRPGSDNRNYFNIIRAIRARVLDLKNQLGGPEADTKPLVIFAHSLGCFIINNYIYDAHKIHAGGNAHWPADMLPQGAFESMINLTGLVTFGCNIPLFVLGRDPLVAIRFPHPELPQALKPKAAWNNYYDPKDVLGWPLKELKYSFARPNFFLSENVAPPPAGVPAYPDVVSADIPIRIWYWWNPASWTLMSHTMYWTHPNFIRPAADYVAGVM